MNARLLPVLLLAVLAAMPSAGRAAEAVFEKRASVTARKILSRSERVLIAGFRVAFNLESAAAAGHKVTLTGVEAADFQRITEEAYEDFKAQLAKEGVTVVDPGVLRASKGYGMLSFTPCSPDRPHVQDFGAGASVAVFTPAELPLFLGHFDSGGLAGETVGLDNWRALNRLSVETRAAVLVPTLVVDFIQGEAGGPDAEVVPQIVLLARLTGVAVFHAKLRFSGELGSLRLGEPLAAPGAFGIVRLVSSGDQPASGRPLRVLVANAADYRRRCLDAMRSFNRMAGVFIAVK